MYKSRTVVEIARGIKASLYLDMGLTRGEVRAPRQDAYQAQQKLGQTRKRPANKDRQLRRLQRELDNSDATKASGIKPENVVWIFGYGRSGSTWLSDMKGELKNHPLWREPMVGLLFDNFYYHISHYGIGFQDYYRNVPEFILGPKKEVWLKLIRSFFLDGASARFPRIADDATLVVKEPNGSVGAPLLMDALPESRMILLIRDPRDVTASVLDAFRKESWGFDVLGKNSIPDIPVEAVADEYMRNMGNAKQAYEAHKGHKVLVRYEDLSSDTLGTMERIYSALQITVDEEALFRVVEKYSWVNIPKDKKGQGKFYRKATPGGWKKDLTKEQAEVVEKDCSPAQGVLS